MAAPIFTLFETKDRIACAHLFSPARPRLRWLGLSLAGCSKPAPQESPSAAASLDATPENAPGTTLTDATVQLPAVAATLALPISPWPRAAARRQLVAVHVDGAAARKCTKAR
jgi:hypothetical protein